MIRRNLLLVFLIALVLRLVLIFSAYHGDLNNNISWATITQENGLNGFYEGENWPYSAPNQPPLTIVTFSFIRKMWILLENTSWWLNNNIKAFPSSFIWFWEQKGMILLIKLPSILADLGIGWLIYSYLSKKLSNAGRKNKIPLIFTSVWLFNPIVWYNSSIWGQTDSIVNLLGIIALLALLDKRLVKFSVFMSLSLLFKGSLFIFAPILFYVALKQRYSALRWIRAFFSGVIVTIIISVWFHPQLDLAPWLLGLYTKRILPGEIGYLTANAFNFWWLVDPGKTFDSIIYFGISARTWSFMLFGTVVATLLWKLDKKISKKIVIFSLAITALASFMFLTRIHERYLYPFFPLATILLGFMPGMWLPYLILTITHFLNLYHLFWLPDIPMIVNLFKYANFTNILSLINIFVFLYILRSLRTSKL